MILVLAPTARAEEGEEHVTPTQGVEQLDKARVLVQRSVDRYSDGRVSASYSLAREAYLEHFEYVEVPLRVRDESLTLQIEEDFARLRGAEQSRASVGTVQAAASDVLRGLDSAERVLAEPGLAGPLLAAGYAFVVLFREGLEAVLLVAAVLGYLEASRNLRYRTAVLRGVGLAVLATIATFLAAGLLITVAPLQRELLEAITALIAVGVLFYVSFWLVARLEHRRWMEFVKARVWAAATTGSTVALAGVGFTAVYREGFETVLFYQALLSFARGLGEWVALGTAVAVVTLAVMAGVIFKASRRLPVKTFLTVAVSLVMLMSVAFIGNAVRAFQGAALLPVTFLEGLPNLPIFVASLTGWYPTAQTIGAQVALALVYLGGALWVFVITPRRERALVTGPQSGAHAAAEETTAASES
jgi:high-affinity iron transporter